MSFFIKIYDKNPSQKALDKVVEVLKKGGIVIYPTDTVYGMCCDIMSSKALNRMAKLKNLKLQKTTFSLICSDLSDLSQYVKQLDGKNFRILKKHLPGPFTFILNGSSKLPKHLKYRKQIGIRIPNHSIDNALVEALGNPLASTSLLHEDEILEYRTDPELIFERWKNQVDCVIDGGYGKNTPSSIVDLTAAEAVLIRKGLGDTSDFA
jgi:tRNA threonylcarbamoyl adenosine modification protein (Sua5/YciO/YrdC/YwlC family)